MFYFAIMPDEEQPSQNNADLAAENALEIAEPMPPAKPVVQVQNITVQELAMLGAFTRQLLGAMGDAHALRFHVVSEQVDSSADPQIITIGREVQERARDLFLRVYL